MLNYDKQSRIFSCILLTRHHMIFLVQFGRNKHLLIFQRAQTARALRACAILLVFIKKNLLVFIDSKLHSKSCDYLHKLQHRFLLLSRLKVNYITRYAFPLRLFPVTFITCFHLFTPLYKQA